VCVWLALHNRPDRREIAPGRYLADAGVSVYDLEEFIGSALPTQGDFDSLGGLMIELAGRVPAAGEAIGIGDFNLTVRKADDRCVRQVEIVRTKPTQDLPS
jgi:CBS domain containing-hemolysin-like protein